MQEITRDFIERIAEAIEIQDNDFLQASLADLHPADISYIVTELEPEEAKALANLLPAETLAEVLSNLEIEVGSILIHLFPTAQVAALMPYMNSNEAADLLEAQPLKYREEVIALIDDAETANNIIELLHYDDDCAGGLMAKELVKANINWNVVQTIEEIRKQAENVEKIYSVYVVDDKDKLMGIVGIKNILLARAQTHIKDIFEEDIISIESFRDSDEVAELMRRYNLETIPVVNMAGRLLGRITIESVVDLLTEQAETDQQLMSGISEATEVDDSIWQNSRARLPWLIIGMAGGLLGANFMGFFEGDLKLVPAMAFFIPLITATGGNVGIQSSTVIIQSLGARDYGSSTYWLKIVRLFLVALINAVVISSLVMGFFLISGRPLKLAIVVAIALFCVIILASVMGTVTPLILNRFGINPALASGPFITTANDLLGLAVYFSVAHMLYL